MPDQEHKEEGWLVVRDDTPTHKKHVAMPTDIRMSSTDAWSKSRV